MPPSPASLGRPAAGDKLAGERGSRAFHSWDCAKEEAERAHAKATERRAMMMQYAGMHRAAAAASVPAPKGAGARESAKHGDGLLAVSGTAYASRGTN